MTFYEKIIKLHTDGQIEGDIEFQEKDISQTDDSNQSTENKTILEHSRDVSIFQIMPEMVFFPKNIVDIQKVLEIVQKEISENPDQKISISVRAGGTCMSGGSLCPNIIINMTRYMKDVVVDPIQRIAFVDMGAMLKDIASEAEKHDLLFGAYPSSRDICGIGGVIGNNASGEKSVRLGATLDNVVGLEVLLADGTIIRTGALENTGEPLKGLLAVTGFKKEISNLYEKLGGDLFDAVGDVHKSASGYRLERIYNAGNTQYQTLKDSGFETATITQDQLDTLRERNEKDEAGKGIDLTPLFVGAQGTLGIVTKAMVALKPIPKHTRLLVVSVDSFGELPFILETIMKFNPEGVETFDINTFNKAKNFLKEETEICQQFFDENTTLVVLAQFSEDNQEETDSLAKKAQKQIETHPVKVSYIITPKVQDSIWKIRRSSFVAVRDYNLPGKHAVPCIEDIIVPIKNFDKLIPGLQQLISKYNIEYGFHGHIGDGSLRIVPVFDFAQPGDTTANTIIDFTREAIALVKSLKGNMSADHSDGIIRTPFLREFYGEKVFEAFVKIKLLFDANGILNRGKKIGGTEDMIRKYIVRD